MINLTLLDKLNISKNTIIQAKLHEVKIIKIIPPFEHSELEKLTLTIKQKLISDLEFFLSNNSLDLDVIFNHLKQYSCNGDDQEILQNTLHLITELQNSHYNNKEKQEYLTWNLRLTQEHFKGVRSHTDKKAELLYNRILKNENYTIVKRNTDESGRNSSYFILDNETNKPFALLKHSNAPILTAFQNHIPNMPLTAKAWEYEYVGYEQDQIFGFDHTPLTMCTSFINEKNEFSLGIIQEFILETKESVEFFDPDFVETIKNLTNSKIHKLAISGILKGLGSGHIGNYLFNMSFGKEKIYEIDLEEMLFPYNRLSGDEELIFKSDVTQEEKKLAYQSIILCRMWILGLPQCEKPFDRAALITMTHPALKTIWKEYYNQKHEITGIAESSWTSQLKRLEIIQQKCIEQLAKIKIDLTPRGLYFEIFGGEHIWDIAKKKKYPPIIAFNNVVSDPCQHVLKNFCNPSLIAESNRLEEPSDSSLAAFRRMNFFRMMEGLEPKEQPLYLK